MMSYVDEDNIRTAAVEYARRQLGQGNALAKLLLDTVNFGEGDFVVLTPTPLNAMEMVQFDWGHAPQTQTTPERIVIGETPFVAFPKVTADDQLVDVIGKLLKNPEDLCLLENSLAQAGDSWLKGARSRVVTNGTDIYHALFSAGWDKTKVTDAIREADGSPIFVGAVGRSPADISARNATLQDISAEQLLNFAKTVRSVFVGAYDGEGYVLWVMPGRAVLVG
jgi:hypothetical protein